MSRKSAPALLRRIPRPVLVLLSLYAFASFLHFTHNAEAIAFYPAMPAWLTSGKVYLAWLAVTVVGAAGIGVALAGWHRTAMAAVAAYGLLGLDGLGHYTLALCSEHTLAANATIWFEVLSGLALAFVAILHGRFACSAPSSHSLQPL